MAKTDLRRVRARHTTAERSLRAVNARPTDDPSADASASAHKALCRLAQSMQITCRVGAAGGAAHLQSGPTRAVWTPRGAGSLSRRLGRRETQESRRQLPPWEAASGRYRQRYYEACSQQSSVSFMGRVHGGMLRGFQEGFEGVLPAHCGTDSTSP